MHGDVTSAVQHLRLENANESRARNERTLQEIVMKVRGVACNDGSALQNFIATSHSHAASQRVSCLVLLLRKRLPGLARSSLTLELPSHKLLIS